MKRTLIALMLLCAMLLPCCVQSEEEFYDDKLTPIAMLGDESDFVFSLESALFEKGYLDEVCVDGYFDEYTEQAVADFQYDKGYEPDGVMTKIQFYWLSRSSYNNWFDSSNIVYITPSGSRYHTWNCKSLDNSYSIMPISVNIAYSYGYLPCRLCKPY